MTAPMMGSGDPYEYRTFRQVPVLVEATQYTGDNEGEIRSFVRSSALVTVNGDHLSVYIEPWGWTTMESGHWLIRYGDGTFAVCDGPSFRTLFHEEQG